MIFLNLKILIPNKINNKLKYLQSQTGIFALLAKIAGPPGTVIELLVTS
jgi:hypothetical protein